jgi:putative ABC transport system permease protein
MTPSEAIRTAVDNLAVHKLRSALTMLGMIFGVGAVIAMLSIGAGAERQALAMVERLGLQNVLVRAKPFRDEEAKEIRAKSPGVSTRDAAALAEAVPGVELAAPSIKIVPYRVLSAAGKTAATAYGVSFHHAALAHLIVAEGRFLDPLDERTHAQVCVVGSGVRRDLFGYGPALGRDLKVNDVWLTVVGVLAPQGGTGDTFQGVNVGTVANTLYLPVTTAERKFEHPPLDSPLDEIVVRLKAGTSASQAAPVMRDLLDRLHGGAADYELVVPEALFEQSRRTQRLFNAVMGAIAGISLLVGGIGIMNIMLATVLERTREIGVRRAVGARSSDIRFQFMVESFAISLIGGACGVAVGLAIARGVATWAGWPTVVTPAAILLSTGVAMAVGLASGIYPASRAAALDPIAALHYE